MLKIYTYKSCDSCRKAIRFLQADQIAFEERPIRETPPTKTELKKMLQFLDGDLRRLFNTSGQDYRKLGLKNSLPSMEEKEAFELLSQNGNLVKRPFALSPDWGLVGFKEDVWRAKVLA
jgi:arsenate reductase